MFLSNKQDKKVLKMKLQIFESIKTGMLDVCYIWRKEYVTVFRDFGALIFFFALPFAYPILYALIYNPEVVRDVPMVVVDNARHSVKS